MIPLPVRLAVALVVLGFVAWRYLSYSPVEEPPMTPESVPTISATNAFYYYQDVDAAWDFYTNVLGFETVADYGFAKILRIAPTSYLTLVDEERGMHSAEEPKSVTLAIVTEQVEGWYAYLSEAGVPMRGGLNVEEGRPHDGFVATDPEGYFLEFERFNRHPENDLLMPMLEGISALGPVGQATTRPAELEIQATVLWLYYNDIDAALAWYEQTLHTRLVVDQGWAKVVPSSSTGFLGFVDGTRGLHTATEEKAVTVAFFVEDVERWFDQMSALPDFELRTSEITDESERVLTFVGYDPEGYFLEWDTFLDVPANARLLETMKNP
jgi:catechol 2,3-dioxygenase-like lactoylglutathione lyase family enzyme